MATFQIAKLVATLVLEDKGFKDKINQSKQSTEGFFNSLKKGAAVLGTVAAALAVAKKGFDLGKEGAQLLMMETRFDRLSVSIGTTSQALMKDLREATRGLYSDAELVQGANDIMALGLAKNHDQVIRLARVIGGLNMNMNQLVLTMTNQTTMRFDALGVRVDGFKEKVKALEEQGMSANEAFNEAFLQQAEEQLLIVGEAADTAAGEFMRFEAAMKNLADTSKKDLARNLEPVLGLLNNLMEREQRVVDILRVHNPELFNQYQALQLITPEMEAYADMIQRAGDNQDGWMNGLLASKTALEQVGDQLETFGVQNTQWASLAVQVASENERYRKTTEDLRVEHTKLTEEIDKAIAAHGKESEEVKNLSDKLEENRAAMAENEKQHKKWVNSKIADLLLARLAVEGLTNAELDYYLSFMVQSGQMTEEDAQMAADIIMNADNRIAAWREEEEAVGEVEEGMHQLSMRYKTAYNQSLTPINYYYSITGHGSFPKPPNGSWFLPGTGGGAEKRPDPDAPPTALAGGGAVMAGQSYLVGERGREIFTPNQSGRVDPVKEQSSPRWDAKDFAREFFKLAEERNVRLVG